MDELEVIQHLGMATSHDVFEEVGKALGNIRRQLDWWENMGEIKLIKVSTPEGSKIVYFENEIHKILFNDV